MASAWGQLAEGLAAAEGGESFHAPGPGIFELPAVFPWHETDGVTKPMLLLFLAAIIVFAFFYAASRRRQLVPGKLQFAGEGAYGFVRNSVARFEVK